MSKRAKLFLALAFLVSACQTKPTDVVNTTEPSPHDAARAILAKHPVILDARSPLDFGVSHVPSAINVAWTDFTQPGSKQKGLLDTDDFALARRLALKGVTPETPVLVIQDAGKADAGWIAWMLRYLGVKTVNTGTPAQFRGTIPREEAPQKNQPMWKPDVRKDLRASPAEGRDFLKGPGVTGTLMTKARSKALQGVPAGALSQRKVVLDVRTEEQRKALPLKVYGWTATTVELPWQNFFKDGALESGSKALEEKGARKGDIILVVSENGLEGGAVTYALNASGWNTVKNLDAGLRGLGNGK